MPTGAVRRSSFLCRPQGPMLLRSNMAKLLWLPVCGVGSVARATAAASDRHPQAPHRSWERTTSSRRPAEIPSGKNVRGL